MRKVLYILGSLSDSDVDWITTAGQVQPVAGGQLLIHEGQPTEFIYLTLEGSLAVTTAAQPGKALATLGPGEVLGEISLLDSRPPTASVAAATDSRVLRIPRTTLNAKLNADTGFAARFYRALAVFLAQRLRATMQTHIKGDKSPNARDVEAPDEIDPDLLDEINVASRRFEWIINRMKGR